MTGRLYEHLDAGTIDLLIGKRRVGDPRGIALFSGQLEWLARTGTEVDLEQPLPLILVAEPSVTRAAVLDALAKAGASWQMVCTSSSYAGLHRGGSWRTWRDRSIAIHGGHGARPAVKSCGIA